RLVDVQRLVGAGGPEVVVVAAHAGLEDVVARVQWPLAVRLSAAAGRIAVEREGDVAGGEARHLTGHARGVVDRLAQRPGRSVAANQVFPYAALVRSRLVDVQRLVGAGGPEVVVVAAHAGLEDVVA